MCFEKNVGITDRMMRVAAAMVLIVIGFMSGWLTWLFYLLAFLLIVTAVLGYCGLYTLLGINTHKETGAKAAVAPVAAKPAKKAAKKAKKPAKKAKKKR